MTTMNIWIRFLDELVRKRFVLIDFVQHELLKTERIQRSTTQTVPGGQAKSKRLVLSNYRLVEL